MPASTEGVGGQESIIRLTPPNELPKSKLISSYDLHYLKCSVDFFSIMAMFYGHWIVLLCRESSDLEITKRK